MSIEGYENAICDDEAVNPELHVLRLDQKEWISRKLAEIKEEYADMLSLKYYYGYSNNEIAGILSISEGNVRIRLMRARKALHEIIGGKADEKAQ